ncbi:LLM class flavin-dependent oxidoreductase [Mycobacterium syngnathidarum]
MVRDVRSAIETSPAQRMRRRMKMGLYLPNFGCCGQAAVLAELAREAEDSGWDGVFIWDHLQVVEPTADPWVALTAMAIATSSIRLGPLVTPVPRRHIVKLAREVSTLDHLSAGRVILGAGAGYAALPDYASFGDIGSAAERADKLDEGLTVLDRLWSGDPVEHDGPHFHVRTDGFTPTVQRPRVPIWTATTRSASKPLARAAVWDGMICADRYSLEIEAHDLEVMVKNAKAQRTADSPLEVIRFGRTTAPNDTSVVEACAQAGATWWMEYTFPHITDIEETRKRVRQGPPRPK